MVIKLSNFIQSVILEFVEDFMSDKSEIKTTGSHSFVGKYLMAILKELSV